MLINFEKNYLFWLVRFYKLLTLKLEPFAVFFSSNILVSVKKYVFISFPGHRCCNKIRQQMAKAIIFQHCGFKTCWEITYWKVTLWRFLSPLCPLFRSINRCPWKLRKLSLNIGFAWFQFDVFIKITCSKNWRRVFCLFFDHSAHWLKNEICTCLDVLWILNFLKNPYWYHLLLEFCFVVWHGKFLNSGKLAEYQGCLSLA